MTWLAYAGITALFYGFFDIFVKLTSGKIDDTLGALIMNSIGTAIVAAAVWFLYASGKELTFTKEGLIYAILAGICIGVFSIALLKAFGPGSNPVVSISIVRVGMVMTSVLIGTLFLKFPLNFQQGVGLIVTAAGLLLILWR